MRRIVLALLTVMLLVGCAGNPAPPESTGSSPRPDPVPPGTPRAVGLVGLWRVSDAAGEQPETWLRLDTVDFQLWRDCGMIMDSWSAGESAFLASPFGGNDECVEAGPPVVAWLESAASYERTPNGWVLMDADHDVVASLTVDGAPEPIESAAEFYAEAPAVTEETSAAFSRSPLPAGTRAASTGSIVGRWVPADLTSTTDPYVEFAADGSWTGSDGCNGGGGRWSSGSDGEFASTAGPSTQIGCEGAPIPYCVASARTAGFDDAHRLLLFDRDGNELCRLVHARIAS